MTQTITDKERQPVILDMARVNSRLIVLRSQYKNILEDADILKKKLLPYYRDKKRFEERMETKYDLTKTMEKLKEKTEELQGLEVDMYIAGTIIVVNYLNQYYETFYNETLSADKSNVADAKRVASNKLATKINLLFGAGNYVVYDFSCPWDTFYEYSKSEDNLKLVYSKQYPENRKDKARTIIMYKDTDMGLDFEISVKMAEEFNIIVMSIVEELLAHKRELEAAEKQKSLDAKEARRMLYLRLKQEFEQEEVATES